MFKLITSLEYLYWVFAPSGRQLEEIAKGVGKVVKKVGPEVAQTAMENPNFFKSFPTWLWVVLGIIAIAGIIYWKEEES